MALQQIVKIKSAPALPWTAQSHRHFPLEFRECVAALLTSHWAYRKRQAAATLHPSLAETGMELTSSSIAVPVSPSMSYLAQCSALTRGQVGSSPLSAGAAVEAGKGSVSASRSSPTYVAGSLSRGTSSLMKLIAGSCRWLPASSSEATTQGSQADSSSRSSPCSALKAMSPWGACPSASSVLGNQPSSVTSSPTDQLVLGPFLAELPHDLFLAIVGFMAPTDQLQDVAKHPHGAPDVAPALLPSDPATWELLPVPVVVIAEVVVEAVDIVM
ncbi:MAG: hypothetical protein WDW36_005577 [Sanguina aurantia]